jgi:plastocyanin
VSLRLRLALTAMLAVLVAVGLHLVAARPAVAAATNHAKALHHGTQWLHRANRRLHHATRRLHQAPAREPAKLARPSHTGGAARLTSTRQRRARRTRRSAHAGGLVLFVSHRGAKAHTAADPSATIVDFSFSPSTITVHVGDTITWTNVGKQPHTATANNGSFNTGILQHGQSGSHTFTAPGTYTYYCIVHPYMKGTVIVLANTTPTTTTPSTTTTTPSATTPTTSSSTNGLPNTGLDIAGVVLCGAALTGLGVALRRRLAHGAE